MALLFLGKLIIAAGIIFQAYQLYEDKASATSFNTQLSTVLKSADFIPSEIQTHLKEYARLVVAGLLGFSVFTVIFRSALLKVPVILGLLSLLIVRHFPLNSLPCYRDQAFWQLVSVIGGYIYLLGAESCCGNKKSQASSRNVEASSRASEPVQKTQAQKGGKPKKH